LRQAGECLCGGWGRRDLGMLHTASSCFATAVWSFEFLVMRTTYSVRWESWMIAGAEFWDSLQTSERPHYDQALLTLCQTSVCISFPSLANCQPRFLSRTIIWCAIDVAFINHNESTNICNCPLLMQPFHHPVTRPLPTLHSYPITASEYNNNTTPPGTHSRTT
jgi:hypothetical protein